MRFWKIQWESTDVEGTLPHPNQIAIFHWLNHGMWYILDPLDKILTQKAVPDQFSNFMLSGPAESVLGPV